MHRSVSDNPLSLSLAPYEVQILPAARVVLEKAPRRSREAIERKLENAAQLASMRQWMEASEGQQPIRIELAGYAGSYSLDPRARQLTLWELSRR